DRLGTKEAGQVAVTLIQAMTKTRDPGALGVFVRGLSALADRLEPEQAGQAADALIQVMTTQPFQLKPLAQVLAALAPRLGPKEARRAATALVQAMTKTRDPGAMR